LKFAEPLDLVMLIVWSFTHRLPEEGSRGKLVLFRLRLVTDATLELVAQVMFVPEPPELTVNVKAVELPITNEPDGIYTPSRTKGR
jgi:hypothetical protein